MSASPARTLIERAAEVYGYDREYLVGPEAAAAAPVVAETNPTQNPFVLSLSKHCPSLTTKKGQPPSTPPPASLRTGFDKLRANGEIIHAAAEEAVASGTVDPIALAEAGYVLPGARPTPLSEEFRIAKRALLASAFGGRGAEPVERGRMMLVCSGSPAEGKTFCALNLALSLAAERDTRVLLVDGDVAKPDILRRLGLADGPGLMDAIADPDADPEALVRETGITNFDVLGAGRAVNDATERLGSARARAVLDALVEADPRRIVVIDSPPVLVASPATALALHAGQAVLVVRADRTTESELRRSYALLSGCETLHLLLNGVTYATSEPGFGSYYATAPA